MFSAARYGERPWSKSGKITKRDRITKSPTNVIHQEEVLVPKVDKEQRASPSTKMETIVRSMKSPGWFNVAGTTKVLPKQSTHTR